MPAEQEWLLPGNVRVKESDRQKVIKPPPGDEFVIRAAFPFDRIELAQNVAEYYRGKPANSYSADDQYIFERNVSLRWCIVKWPDWWKGPEECIDASILNKLFEEFMEWSREVQDLLKKNKLGRSGGKPTVSQ